MQNQINTKADKLDTYPKAKINVALGILHAGINRKVWITVVDSHGIFKIHDVSSDILKTQRVDLSLVYDAFELSFNNVDKRNILTNNTVDILQSINNNAVSVNVCSKSEIDTGLNLKADKFNTSQKLKLM